MENWKNWYKANTLPFLLKFFSRENAVKNTVFMATLGSLVFEKRKVWVSLFLQNGLF